MAHIGYYNMTVLEESEMDTILKVQAIEKYYGNKGNISKAIEHMSFEVEKGEFVGIMGPSGSGKTTLLNCISTIDQVSTGKIIINDTDITRLKGKKLESFRGDELGFIFQDFNLIDTLTAYENIALALTLQSKAPKDIDAHICQVAQRLGITEVLMRYPYEISGGQKQRVAAARAIIKKPSLILADEPTGALDSKSSRMLLEMLQQLNETLCATILMVTHDAFSASFASRILFIKDGEIFSELVRGNDDRKTFFNRIMEVVTLLGGEMQDVF